MDAVFQFPGQGAQYPGMGKDFYEEFPLVQEIYEEAEDVLKMPLAKICFTGDAEELKKTVNSQVLIFVTSYALFRVLQKFFPEVEPKAAAGLSLGEYTALCALGFTTFAKTLKVIHTRAVLMEKACENTEGAMVALMGWSAGEVEQFVRQLHMPQDVWIANYNCPGQTVLSGTKKGMEIAAGKAKEMGVRRALPLKVQGAFHSGLMRFAQEAFAPAIEELSITMQKAPIIMNVTAKCAKTEQEVRENLLKQVTGSVRWEQSIETMNEIAPMVYLEVGPGKTLSGFMKRMSVQAPYYAIEQLADLDKISEARTKI